MTDISVSRLDGQDLKMPITATRDGVAYDPTGDAVSVAVLPTGTEPGISDWRTARWITLGGVHYVFFPAGPRADTGLHKVWYKVPDASITIIGTGTNQVFYY
jgi:hypothetical protein